MRVFTNTSFAVLLYLGALTMSVALPAAVDTGAERGGSAVVATPVRFDSLEKLFAFDAPVSIDRVKYERKETTSVRCAFFPGRTMKRIDLEFVSQTYRGVEVKHQARLFIPEPRIADRAMGGVAIIMGKDGTEAKEAGHDWVESVVAGLGVPCLVVPEVFSKEEFQVKNLGQLMSQGDRAYFATGDVRETGYYALARIFSAAATVASALPEAQATRFVATGSSKGGMAAMIVLAGDPRFAGAFPTAWNTGDIKEATRLKGERWGWDVKPKETGPAGESARNIWQRFGDRRFQEYLDFFEVDRWGDKLKGKFVMPAVGTNDHLSHLLSDQYYADDLKAEWAFLRVADYGHGRGTMDHALGWRHAVAATFLGQRTPGMRLQQKSNGEQASLHLSLTNLAGAAIKELRLYSTTDPTGDYRRAKWEGKSISLPSGSSPSSRILMAETKIPKTGTVAFFARVVVQGEICDAINCSNVIELGAPVIQTLAPQ